ncbi:MAG: SH3 domain-containing protein [Anaerolineaceae bacterium]|nr:SH3 domain-containing protein [Anaerolineaceae bacterium]
MKKYQIITLTVIVLALLLAVTVSAQQTIEPIPDQLVNPNAHISWPPPIYVLRGQFTIRGSANLPSMTSYFIEFRPLAEDLSPQDEIAPWFPAVLPTAAAVQDDILGVWNTTTAPDGVYELRMTINIASAEPFYFRVSPLRVENNPPPFAVTPTPQPVIQATSTSVPQVVAPTLIPTPTAFDTTPRVTAIVDANVRRGDSTQYEVMGALLTGQSAQVVGISSFGSNWYLIQLPNGTRGWIAPSVVNASGNMANVPLVSPPAPPTPTFTPTPAAQVNLVAGNITFNPASPNCAQTFNVFVDIANFGTTANTITGTISVVDTRAADGSVQQTTVGAFGVIQPGQTINVGPIPITVSTYYGEEHRISIVVDSAGQIAETNEGDNSNVKAYTLNKASCP